MKTLRRVLIATALVGLMAGAAEAGEWRTHGAGWGYHYVPSRDEARYGYGYGYVPYVPPVVIVAPPPLPPSAYMPQLRTYKGGSYYEPVPHALRHRPIWR
jgi:hypothetical protein